MSDLGSSRDIFFFLTGAAGTGKTYIVQEEIKRNSLFGLVTATTGIAAINIGGVTINSVLGFYNDQDMYIKYKSGVLLTKLRRIKEAGYLSLIIDEASMLNSFALDVLYNLVEALNSKDFYKFRLILVGDLLQLPPVKAKGILHAQSWKYFKINLLTEVKRQSDVEFISALNSIRLGDTSKALTFLTEKGVFTNEVDKNFVGTTLFSKNHEVNNYNNYRLSLINKPERVYKAQVEGIPSVDWKNIPNEIVLKEDSLVMILCNAYSSNQFDELLEDSFLKYELRYANGDLALCKHLGKDSITVELLRTGQEVLVEPVYRVNEIIYDRKKKIIGRIRYLPVRLAYGTTLHKSQGLTLDNVQIDINSSFISRIPGALYVAISRAKSVDGLRLVGTPDLFKNRCVVDRYISRFYNNLSKSLK